MVLFHLLDDEILDLYHAKVKLKDSLVTKLQEDLYMLLAIIPADEVVVISPTFLFENVLCEEVLRNNMDLIENYYVTILMKEADLYELNSKKQERYERVANHTKYTLAYYRNRIKQLIDIPFAPERKNTSIGATSFSICIELLRKEQEKDNIDPRLFDEIIKRLIETETTSFLWESVCEQLENAKIPADIVRKLKIREIMSQSYLEAYQTEGIALAQDPMIYPNVRKFQNTKTYDLIRIGRVLSFLNLRIPILTMTCKEFCKLKKDGDYILTIKKVHDLLQTTKSSEEIMEELKVQKVDEDLRNIFRRLFRKDEGVKLHMTDVLIMLATNDEEGSIISKGGWKREKLPSGQTYFTRIVNDVLFALVRGYNMGESDAAIMAQKFIENLNPKVIAMAGFCAGKSGRVNLGDIIVANKVYNYDVGKQNTQTETLPEISNYSLDGEWLQYIERLDDSWKEDMGVEPPVDFNWQVIELLDTLRKDSTQIVDQIYNSHRYPNWKEVVEELMKLEYIKFNIGDSNLILTDEGRVYITEYMMKNRTNEVTESRLFIGPIATGTRVQVWSDIFTVLESRHDRKTCALDMESHVIGKLSAYNKIPFIVVKGVGDYANDGKVFANRFIEYTSCLSCHFIVKLFSSDDFRNYWK